MLAERYVPLKNIVVSTSSCVRGHYLLTVNTYFFVSTILKVLPSFPSVSVWYLPRNTDRYQPNYTDYQEILTDTNQKIPTRYTTLVNTQLVSPSVIYRSFYGVFTKSGVLWLISPSISKRDSLQLLSPSTICRSLYLRVLFVFVTPSVVHRSL